MDAAAEALFVAVTD